MKLFNDKTDFAILIFILLVVFMLGYCEQTKAEWSVEYFHDSNAGSTNYNSGLDRICGRYTYPSDTSVSFCPVVAVRGKPKRDSFELGVADRWGKWEGQINLVRYAGEMDGGFSFRRIIGDGKFNTTLGGTYWINQSPGSNSDFTFNLGLRYTF